MKKNKILALCLGMAMMPLAVSAQENVKEAFDKLINSPDVKVTESHTMSRDPKTKEKTSQKDIYQFTMPPFMMSLIKDIQEAFRRDNEEAYKISSGVIGEGSSIPAVLLAVGNGENSVGIGTTFGMNYAYSCFLAPEDSLGKCRYAYAYEWSENNKGIEGKLVVTYATTMGYRQSVEEQAKQKFIFRTNDSKRWLDKMMFNINEMSKLKFTSKKHEDYAMAYSKMIYELTKQKENVFKEDIEVARNMLRQFRETFNVPQIEPLLDGALENLK